MLFLFQTELVGMIAILSNLPKAIKMDMLFLFQTELVGMIAI